MVSATQEAWTMEQTIGPKVHQVHGKSLGTMISAKSMAAVLEESEMKQSQPIIPE